MNKKKQLSNGFTLIEIAVVMIIIGILAVVTYVAYGGLQTRARDISILSDLDHMDSVQANYGLKNNVSGKAYYSLNGPDSALDFTPSTGNVVSVVIDANDYCIRGYNPIATKNSISNSYIKESTSGVCATIAAIYPPQAPVITVGPDNSNVKATIQQPSVVPPNPPLCVTGTIQYHIRSNINDGAWTEYSPWSVALTASQAVTQGTKYSYQAEARCYSGEELISDSTLGSVFSYTSPVDAPPAPVISVAYIGGTMQANIDTPSSCTAGSLEYRFASRANESSTWGDYTAWSSAIYTTQSPIEGTKYGFNAQARCYVSPVSISSPSSASTEATYIHPITTVPATPAVHYSTPDWYWTNYSWDGVTCPVGASIRYQYHFYNNNGFDSGWIATAGNSNSFTTAKIDYYFTNDVKAQCYSTYSTGPWSAVGWVQYHRPVPTVRLLVVAGGGAGGASSSDDSGGGGGGGGVLHQWGRSVWSQGYGIWVGSGGIGSSAHGDNSSFNNEVTAYGGGGGGPTNEGGYNGGSGGGGAGAKDGSTNSRGYATNNGLPTGGADFYGQNGGNGQWRKNGKSGGGGGGAGQCGGSAYDGDCGGKMVGGSGAWFDITGGGVYYAAGGGGGSCCYWGNGGQGGGGNGAQGGRGGDGANNTGSGGGGGSPSGGGNGGTGIVIIRYPVGSLWADGGSKYQNGSDYVHVFYYTNYWQAFNIAG